MSDTAQLDLAAFGASAPEPTARPLPKPGKPRFQPLRAGILNVWQYEDQVLHFHDGRLILRGENGSGKSKALEVLLPFLLDADLSPYRLDPFQGQGRSMRWNLLEGGRHESRVGYVWLELGRRAPGAGDPLFVTLGCGLRATRRTNGVDAWYFITGRRIGEPRAGGELSLLTPGRQPLSKKQLRLELGDGGTVFQNAGEYRNEVDKRLYELGADRFTALRHLLLQLRRPQLSEKLDPGKLSDLLGMSLPPIEEDLIGELAELFERLAHHEKELVRLRSAIAAVEAFLAVYREYCRGIARGCSGDVRRSDSRHRAKAEELKATEEQTRAVREQLSDLERRRLEQRQQLDEVRGKIRALEQSDAMRAAQALAAREDHTRTLEEQAERDVRDEARLGEDLERHEREHAAAGEEEARRRQKIAEPERRAAEGAARVGLEGVHEAARQKLTEHVTEAPPRGDSVAHDEEARGTVRAAVRERHRAAGELRALVLECDRAEELFRRCEERRRDADEQVRAAHERERDAEAAASEEAARLDDALIEWAEASGELDLDDEELERLRAAVPSEADPFEALPEAARGADLPAILAGLVAGRRDRLVEERTALGSRIKDQRKEHRATAEERCRVAAARELGPEPARVRPGPREDRPGAPFYLLCDFAEGLGEDERAGLEAALEAAGLLDAWVMPDGRLLDPETLDAVLVPGPAAGDRILAEVLVAGDSGDVEAQVVEEILASIELGTGGDGRAAAGVDGSFRLGPLAGRWMKPEAEHLGAAAREAARRRRLAELDARLAEQEARIAELEAGDRALGERLERLATEARRTPRTAELERRRHAAAAAAADLARRRGELIEAENAVAAARRARDEARRRLDVRAGELRLAAWSSDLETFRDLVRDYQVLFDDLARVLLAAKRAAVAAERAGVRLAETRERLEEAARRAARSRRQARSARSEVEVLRATIGVEGREIIARHGRAVSRREQLETSLEELQDRVIELRERRAVVDERRRHQAAELAERDRERRRAAERLGLLVEAGFLDLVLEDGATLGGDEAPGGSWSLRRALHLAREIAKQTSDVDLSPAAADRRINSLMPRYRELDGEIGGDFQPRLDQEGELVIFRVSHQQRDHDGPRLAAVLSAEVAEREGELAEEERELMRRILLGDVGDHLRGRLRQAHDLVGEMNGLLVACPTASGMTLRLSWRADEDAESKVREVLRLLLRDPELLGDPERRLLEGFFQGRIEEARQDHVLVPWREHLIEALDYRRWHRFQIERRMPGEATWSRLTQKSHAASSGGERAVALHLPLFAAAAAHYRSARDEAPKLILLDEAFAGIDPGMRGRCMALLVEFDLDFMMTSYDEWGCYEELPGVATYQLYRDPSAGGVEAIRFVWNGERLIEEDEA